MHALEKFLMICPHELLPDTHITKMRTVAVNDLVAYVRTVNFI